MTIIWFLESAFRGRFRPASTSCTHPPASPPPSRSSAERHEVRHEYCHFRPPGTRRIDRERAIDDGDDPRRATVENETSATKLPLTLRETPNVLDEHDNTHYGDPLAVSASVNVRF
jgi:hypothetical protein